ncbi:MAG: LamG-like jellyroll fold domain-containing protein, partial [archaeon]
MDNLNVSGQPTDLSSYSNNGTLNGTAKINSTSGFFGNGSWFDGANGKIVVPDSESLDSPGVSDKITICAWINIKNHGSGFKGIIGKWKLDERQYLLGKDTATNKYGLLLSSNGLGHAAPNGAALFTDAVLNTSQWYHLCGTYNGTNMYVYLDSVKQSTTANSGGIYNLGSGNLEIGTFYNSFLYTLNGMIDEVLIFNRSLSSDEIKSLYNSSQYKFDYEFNNLTSGQHTLKGYDINKFGSLNSTGLFNINIVNSTNNSNSSSVENPINLTFVLPTPTEDVSGNSIYVNLSTNGSERYSFVNFDNDLILWMRMDDQDVGTLIDKSSYLNDGVFKNGAVTTTGLFGQALKVNGSNYVNILDSDSLDSPGLTDQVTICAWINASQHGAEFTGIVGKYDSLSGNNRQYLIAKNNVDNKYGIFLSSYGTTFDANVLTDSALNTNQWYHLCGTNNGSVNLYLNGVLQVQTATLVGGIMDNTAANLTIGKFGRNNSEFNGSIDEVLIFKRGLSQQEIRALYNSSLSRFEHNYTNLANGSHTFTGYVVNKSANYLSSSKTISSGNIVLSAPVLTLLSNTSYENFFNIEYELNTTNSPTGCVFSRDGANNISMVGQGSGRFSSSESLTAGVYNITFSCTNDYGTGILEKQFVLRKSITKEHTYFTNSENLKIYFDFYFNTTKDNGPLLIVPDSWASAKDSYRAPVMTAFRPEGYAVLLVDTRGKGSSEGSRGAFLEECFDIYEAINEVRTNPLYSSYVGDRVYIWGFSAGGGRAGVCSARYPDLFSAIFSTGGVLNVTKWYSLNPSYQSDLTLRIGGTPATRPEDYSMRDASHMNYNALSPAMVTHYQGDGSVNVALSRDYNDSMNQNGNEIRYDEYVGGSHAIVGLSDSISYFAEHTNIYSIPSSGDFILSGYLFNKNFSVKFNNITKLGHIYYDIFGNSRSFNVSSFSYNGGANLSLFDLSSNEEYSISINGVTHLSSSNSLGDMSFNFSVLNSSISTIVVSPAGDYCGDSVCNNGETCSSCSNDCGICVVVPPTTGSSGGGGGGGGGSPVVSNTTGAGSRMEISSIKSIVYPGEEKSLQVVVKNKGTTGLNKCKLVPATGSEGWIESKDLHNIGIGEIVEFDFLLEVPSGSSISPEISVVCLEGSAKVPLTIVKMNPSLNVKISKINLKSDRLDISYDIGAGAQITTELVFRVLDSSGKEISKKTEKIDVTSQTVQKNVLLDISNAKTGGELKILVLRVGEDKPLLEDSILYNPATITGFASGALSGNGPYITT